VNRAIKVAQFNKPRQTGQEISAWLTHAAAPQPEPLTPPEPCLLWAGPDPAGLTAQCCHSQGGRKARQVNRLKGMALASAQIDEFEQKHASDGPDNDFHFLGAAGEQLEQRV
jgi:hypothetical protein